MALDRLGRRKLSVAPPATIVVRLGRWYHLRWSRQQRPIGVACESHCDRKVSPDRVDAQTVANSPHQVKNIQN
jgi:hypothetical protein